MSLNTFLVVKTPLDFKPAVLLAYFYVYEETLKLTETKKTIYKEYLNLNFLCFKTTKLQN